MKQIKMITDLGSRKAGNIYPVTDRTAEVYVNENIAEYADGEVVEEKEEKVVKETKEEKTTIETKVAKPRRVVKSPK